MYADRVAVLRGGPSDEYDLSLRSGAQVVEALRSKGYFVKDIVVSRQVEWLHEGRVFNPHHVLSDVDAVFIALQGAYGNDGTVQRIIDRINLPYTGSNAFASNLSLNKYLAKKHLAELGIKMPEHMHLTRDGLGDISQTAFSISQMFGPRYVVKPVSSGSSLDIYYVEDFGILGLAIENSLKSHSKVLVEEYIEGRHATVGLLENFRDEDLYALPVVETPLETNSFIYSNDQKTSSKPNLICPAPFTKEEKSEMERVARLVHKVLNLSHYSRTDFIVAKEGIFFLEINPRPALDENGSFVLAANSIGASYVDLTKQLLDVSTGSK